MDMLEGVGRRSGHEKLFDLGEHSKVVILASHQLWWYPVFVLGLAHDGAQPIDPPNLVVPPIGGGANVGATASNICTHGLLLQLLFFLLLCLCLLLFICLLCLLPSSVSLLSIRYLLLAFFCLILLRSLRLSQVRI